MVGSKSFTGGQPRTGQQRSAEQIRARQDDLLAYLNEIFVFADTAGNYGKVVGFDDSTGELAVFEVLKYVGDVPVNKVLVGDGIGGLDPEFAVIGSDTNYSVGPDGTNGQIAFTDGAGNIAFQNPPASTVFVDQAGNFTATPNVNYNIDGGAQITIDTGDVVAGFSFKVRPKYGEVFGVNNPVALYNSTNPFENFTENLNLNVDAEYEFYSQDGTTIEFTVKGVSKNG
tara:strand:+ start:10112 stop:10795 length:684 start_codon:yes stop_codon:yes gene_type:complete